MKVAIIGGTGFIGSYIVDALVQAGHTPRLLVRPGSANKLDHPEKCETVTGDVQEREALLQCMDGADAAIYLIGILREMPEHGVTFDALHRQGAEQTMLAAREMNARRFLLMSANGVRPGGTPYQTTKLEAEEALRASDLDWTIFRPSVVFGDPRGRMEFCTQLKQEIIDSPLPAPLFYGGLLPVKAGEFEMAPVAVTDVAEAFTRALERPETIGQILQLCGPERLTWKQILSTIAAAVGKKKLMLPAPAPAVKLVAGVLDRQPWFPVTRDQITMLMQGNVCDEPGAFDLLGIEPTRFDAINLSYLRGG